MFNLRLSWAWQMMTEGPAYTPSQRRGTELLFKISEGKFVTMGKEHREEESISSPRSTSIGSDPCGPCENDDDQASLSQGSSSLGQVPWRSEAEAAASWLASCLSESNVKRERINNFSSALCGLIEERCKHSWYPEQPTRCVRCVCDRAPGRVAMSWWSATLLRLTPPKASL